MNGAAANEEEFDIEEDGDEEDFDIRVLDMEEDIVE